MGAKRPVQVLIVEDDATILEILREGLAEDGYRALGVATIEEGVRALDARRFDLVLTDALRPPGAETADGWWAALAPLREAAAGTPIVIVTAHRASDYADYRARGYAALLAKPFDLDELYAVVRRVLGER